MSLILDGENAWEYYPGNGREFLRRFYGRISGDEQIQALTMSEAIRGCSEPSANGGNLPGFMDQREF